VSAAFVVGNKPFELIAIVRGLCAQSRIVNRNRFTEALRRTLKRSQECGVRHIHRLLKLSDQLFHRLRSWLVAGADGFSPGVSISDERRLDASMNAAEAERFGWLMARN
jgi:hypothetical protein